jgi:hypothetical protein
LRNGKIHFQLKYAPAACWSFFIVSPTGVCFLQVNAKVFVQGNSGLSYLAARVRAARGSETVATLVHSDGGPKWLEADKEAAERVMYYKELDEAKEREEHRYRTRLREKLSAKTAFAITPVATSKTPGAFTKPAVWKRWASREKEMALRHEQELTTDWAKALAEGPGRQTAPAWS